MIAVQILWLLPFAINPKKELGVYGKNQNMIMRPPQSNLPNLLRRPFRFLDDSQIDLDKKFDKLYYSCELIYLLV